VVLVLSKYCDTPSLADVDAGIETPLQNLFDAIYEKNIYAMYRLQNTVAELETSTKRHFYQSEHWTLYPRPMDDLAEMRQVRLTDPMRDKLKALKPIFVSPRRYFFDEDVIDEILGAKPYRFEEARDA
jgi:hypothetical protein